MIEGWRDGLDIGGGNEGFKETIVLVFKEKIGFI